MKALPLAAAIALAACSSGNGSQATADDPALADINATAAAAVADVDAAAAAAGNRMENAAEATGEALDGADAGADSNAP